MDNQDYGPIPMPPCEHPEGQLEEIAYATQWCKQCGAWRVHDYKAHDWVIPERNQAP